jgi:hypothetical protein
MTTTDHRELKRRFTDAMLSIYEKAQRLNPPYRPKAFRQGVLRDGGKEYAEYLLAAGPAQSGFTELFMRGKENLALSVEYLVLQEPWRSLFTPAQREEARRRLRKVDFDLPPELLYEVPPEVPLAEEISGAAPFLEGAVTRVLINSYERNPIARAKCIAHYGTQCTACGFDFEAVYGPTAAGYIHVHHLTPLASIGREYEVDPIVDLRPVCANCHAMIHLGGQHRTIAQVQALIHRVTGKGPG